MQNREEGDDLYQDSLVAAVTRFDKLRDLESFRPWLYRIMVNRFKNTIRSPWWRSFVPMTREIETAATEIGPANRFHARRQVKIAMSVLTSEQQAMVSMAELEGWSMADMARALGASENTVKTRLFRARRKMREALIKATLKHARKAKSKPIMSEDEVCVAAKPSGD